MSGQALTLQQVQRILAEYAPGDVIPLQETIQTLVTFDLSTWTFPPFHILSVRFYDGVFIVRRIYSLASMQNIKQSLWWKRYGLSSNFHGLFNPNVSELKSSFFIQSEFTGDGKMLVTKASGFLLTAYIRSFRGDGEDLTSRYLAEQQTRTPLVYELDKMQVRLFTTLLCSAFQRKCFNIRAKKYRVGSSRVDSSAQESPRQKVTEIAQEMSFDERIQDAVDKGLLPPYTTQFQSSPHGMVPHFNWKNCDPANPEASFIARI